MAPQAIPIFSPEPPQVRNEVEENKDKRPALTMTCEMTESGKNIKKLLESVLKTPLKYVR